MYVHHKHSCDSAASIGRRKGKDGLQPDEARAIDCLTFFFVPQCELS
jgi:hypothetical protein